MHLYLLLKLLTNDAALVDVHVMSPFSRNHSVQVDARRHSSPLPLGPFTKQSKVELGHTLRSTLSCQLRDAAIASFNLLSSPFTFYVAFYFYHTSQLVSS